MLNLLLADDLSFGLSFVRLFSEMDPISATCLVVGLVLVMVEIFQPGFGIFGIVGSIVLVAGIVARMLHGGNLAMLFIMVFFILLLTTIGFLIMARLIKSGWLSRTPIVQDKTAVPIGHTEGTKDFSELVGKQGITATFLKPIGKANFDDVYYDVISANSMAIESGMKIQVVSVEGQKILVEEIN